LDYIFSEIRLGKRHTIDFRDDYKIWLNNIGFILHRMPENVYILYTADYCTHNNIICGSGGIKYQTSRIEKGNKQ